MTKALSRYSLLLIALFCANSVYTQTEQNCPKLELVGPTGILSTGDNAEFRVAAKDGTDDISAANIQWTVSLGTITKGQGTPTIDVSTPSAGMSKITAKVTATSPACNSLLSGEWRIVYRSFDPVDDFGKVSRWEAQARIDNMFTQIKLIPNSKGIFMMRFEPGATPAYKTSRIRLFLQCIKYRKYDLTEVSFYFEPENGDERTIVLIMAAGSKFEYGPSRLIKGEEISSKLKTLFR